MIIDLLYKFNLHFVPLLIPSFLSFSIVSLTYITVLVNFFLYRAAFDLCSLFISVCHVCSICLHYVHCLSHLFGTPSICVFPPNLAPTSTQIRRPVSARRPNDLTKACSFTSRSRSVQNPPASRCRPLKTGE